MSGESGGEQCTEKEGTNVLKPGIASSRRSKVKSGSCSVNAIWEAHHVNDT